jgi:beta-glucanase (GH16 family)
MKTKKLVTVVFFLVTCAANIVQAQRYELVWSDEFESNQLDTETWNVWRGSAFNNELQCYTDQSKNISVSDGILRLTAHRESIRCGSILRSYSSGRISTDTLNAGWEYGRFEVRAKMPSGTGFWPAFWLMPARLIDWPKGGEIDILEYRGNIVHETNAAIHYWREGCVGNSATCRVVEEKTKDTGLDLSQDFNLYALEWTPEKLVWFFNDEPYFEVDLKTLSAEFNPFTGPFYIILNLAVGGNYLPNPTPTTVFPQSYSIDYVRVFQDVNEAPQVDLSPIDTSFGAGESILLNPGLLDPDGSIIKADFYIDGELVGTVNEAPFSLELDPLMEGCYEVTVIATDNDGTQSPLGNSITVTVGEGCINKAFGNEAPVIPTSIPMWRFNHGGQGVAYFDSTPAINLGTTDESVPRIFDAVDIKAVDYPDTDFAVFESVTGEWMRYTVDSPHAGKASILFTVSSQVNSSFDVALNGHIVGSFNRIRTGDQIAERLLSDVDFIQGNNDIIVTTRIGNLTWFTMDIATSSPVSIEDLELLIPESVELLSAYPNPFNPSTQLQLHLPETDEIRLELFNISGSKVTEIHQGMLPSGLHRFQLDMTSYASGLYFVRLATSTTIKVLPITLLR